VFVFFLAQRLGKAAIIENAQKVIASFWHRLRNAAVIENAQKLIVFFLAKDCGRQP
jgi:hypothetical protein